MRLILDSSQRVLGPRTRISRHHRHAVVPGLDCLDLCVAWSALLSVSFQQLSSRLPHCVCKQQAAQELADTMGCGASRGRASAHVVPSNGDEDAAQELEEPSSFEEAINEIFPQSFEVKDMLDCTYDMMGQKGFTADNTIACVATSRDELTAFFVEAVNKKWSAPKWLPCTVCQSTQSQSLLANLKVASHAGESASTALEWRGFQPWARQGCLVLCNTLRGRMTDSDIF
eukprot:SAG31_NODE_4125_length_3561_cov_1.766898_1_plen_229_part_00